MQWTYMYSENYSSWTTLFHLLFKNCFSKVHEFFMSYSWILFMNNSWIIHANSWTVNYHPARVLSPCLNVIRFTLHDSLAEFVTSHWQIYWNDNLWNQYCFELKTISVLRKPRVVKVNNCSTGLITRCLTKIWRQIWKLFLDVKYGSAAFFSPDWR